MNTLKHAVLRLAVYFAFLSLAVGQIDPYKPIAQLRLTDGRVLFEARVFNIVDGKITIRHKGGLVSVKVDDLPPEYAHALEPFLPASEIHAPPKPPEQPEPEVVVAPTAIQAEDVAGSVFGAKIRGQVFIVTKGGTNFKLGLVSISIYPKSAFDSYVHQVKDKYGPKFRDLERRSKITATERNWAKSIELDEQWLLLRFLCWDDLPPAPASTKTDADGKFELNHKVGAPFVVFARATRNVGKEVERYVWAVGSDKIKDDDVLLLSNDNQGAP